MEISDTRWTQLNRMSKETLISIYLQGVNQTDGGYIASAGPASELRKWKKIELVQSLLEIGWPGVPR